MRRCDLVGTASGHYSDLLLSADGGLGGIGKATRDSFMRVFRKGGMQRDVALSFM
jgi:hypothetical protein